MTTLGDSLRRIVGERHVVEGGGAGELSSAPFLVKPATTREVSELLSLASERSLPVVPVGGRTGTVRGADPTPGALLLSLERMNAIEEIDVQAMTATAQAGVVLQTLQEQVERQGAVLPLDLGARGSATVGGIVSTNAGGLRAVKWGVARDMVLGVEAVLADGRVVSGLRKLLKNNAGYDWKQLLIGSEGTLGIVTRAVLRLRPRRQLPVTAMLACASFDRALALLRELEARLPGGLTTFELAWRNLYEFVVTAPGWRHDAPLPPLHAFYALIELEGGPGVEGQLEAVAHALLEERLIVDGVVAKSVRQQQELWATRDDLTPLATLGPILPYDVSVPIPSMGELAERVERSLAAALPEARLFTFGHAGDGNLHFVVAPGEGRAGAQDAVDEIVYAHVAALDGSISAEHGIGLSKRDKLHWCRTPAELDLMRTLKRALDPKGILNPGKVVPAESAP